jgi:hypothetical protein
MPPGGIRTHNLSRRAAADLRLRPCGQQYETLHKQKFEALEGKLREDQLKKLKCYFRRQQSTFRVATKIQQQFHFISEIFVQKSKSRKYMKYCTMKAAQKQQLLK